MPDQHPTRKSRRGGRRPGRACPELVEGAPAPAPRAKPSWGGKREGAGAPKGNLNALKHGANSQQLQQLAIALSLVPDARKSLPVLWRALARLVRRQRRQQTRARTVAINLLTNLLRTCLQTLQAGDDHPYSDTVTIVSNTDPHARPKKNRDINQTPQSNPPDQSNPPVGQGPSPAAS